MMITVEEASLAAFREKLPHTGCQEFRMRRRGYASDGVAIRDIEVSLPRSWEFSMSDALYDLPGVRMVYSLFGGPRGWRRWLHNFLFWVVVPSGTH
jgi:hypothetical protein